MEASFARKQEAELLSLSEWWQIHMRVPSHTLDGRELTDHELVAMISLREQGCKCEPIALRHVEHVGYQCEKCSRVAIDTDCNS